MNKLDMSLVLESLNLHCNSLKDTMADSDDEIGDKQKIKNLERLIQELG